MVPKKTAQGKSHSNANRDAHPGARSYYCHAFDSISVRTEPRSLNFHMLHTCTWRIWYIHIWNTITNDRLHSSKKWMVCRSHENGYILLLIHLRRARKIFIAVHHFNIFTSFTLSRCQHGYLLVLIHVQRAREIFLKGNSKIFTGWQNRSIIRLTTSH